jgi:hypothetical protein
LLFTDAFEENGQIVMVVKLKNIDFPCDFVVRAMFNRDGEISSVIEASELTRDDWAALGSSSNGFLDHWFFFRFKKGGSFSTETFTFLKDG